MTNEQKETTCFYLGVLAARIKRDHREGNSSDESRRMLAEVQNLQQVLRNETAEEPPAPDSAHPCTCGDTDCSRITGHAEEPA